MKVSKLLCVVLLAVHAASAFALSDEQVTRNAFLNLIERPDVPLKPELTAMPEVAGLRKFHLWYQSDASQRVPGYLLLPDAKTFKGRRPVLIALHGTGGSKDSSQIVEILTRAAQKGFIGVAIDGRYHGERTQAGKGDAEYDAAIARAFVDGKEHPFYYDTVWDVMRLIDYLQTRKDVDAARIGLTGISKGGIETYLTAAADVRVACAVSFIGLQSFQWELDNGQWRARIATIQQGFNEAAKAAGKSPDSVEFVREFYARVAPGIASDFDGPGMLPLVAPRPFMAVNSDSDANTPIAGVRLAIQAAFPGYLAEKAGDRLRLSIQENTGHKVNPESIDEALKWFKVWLAP